MKNSLLTKILVFILLIYGKSAFAERPTIQLIFSDPQGICKTNDGKTQFAFNYRYIANENLEYYSGPVYVTQALSPILVPPPVTEKSPYSYTDFEITDQGDCGNLDLDYNNLGSCYGTNLIPVADQQTPYSYKITLTPQLTGDHTYGKPMYNLSCIVELFSH